MGNFTNNEDYRTQFSVSDFFFLMGSFDKLETVGYYYSIREVEYYFRASYPLAHSIATLVGLAPYRRSVAKMISRKKDAVVLITVIK
jgi:hypothetical protein